MKKALSIFICSIMAAIIFPITASAMQQVEIKSPQRFESLGSVENLDSIVDIDQLEEYLFENFYQCVEKIDMSSFNISYTETNVNSLCEFIWKEMPQSFHVSTLRFHYYSSNNKISAISPEYDFSALEYQRMYAEMESAKNELLSGIKGNTAITDVQKALLIHDRLALKCEYTYSSDNTKYSAYGALVKGSAVCEGYAHAYQYLLNEVGIKNYFCVSEALNHGWNIVYIDNKPYHVDVTWDDYDWQIKDRSLTGRVNHQNFLRSTNGIKSTGHTASDFDSYPVDTTYDNYFWQNSSTAFEIIGDELYYIDNNSEKLMRYGDQAELCDVSSEWTDPPYRYQNHASLTSDGTNLLYSLSDKIYRFDPLTNTSSLVYAPELSPNHSIYAIKYYNQNIYYETSDAPPGSSSRDIIQEVVRYYPAAPIVSFSLTDDFASSQTITINMPDNVSGYYLGTSTAYNENPYTAKTGNIATQILSQSGTYNLFIKDSKGIVFPVTTFTLYKTVLDTKGGAGTLPYILTKSGCEFTLPSLQREGYIFKGWTKTNGNSYYDYKSGDTFTVNKNSTLYAVWQPDLVSVEVNTLPDKTQYYVRDSLDIQGLSLLLTYGDRHTEVVNCELSNDFSYNYDFGSQGTSTVTVTYKGKTTTFDVTVIKPYLEVSQNNITMFVGDTVTVTATTFPGDMEVTWVSYVNFVNVNNGTITATWPGNYSVYAKFSYMGIQYSTTINVNVVQPVTDITITSTTINLEEGKTAVLYASVLPNEATNRNIIWSNDNPDVAIRNEDGTVIALKTGVAIITATSVDGGFSKTCIITVTCAHDWAEIVNPDCLIDKATCNTPARYYKSCSKCSEISNQIFKHFEYDYTRHNAGSHVVGYIPPSCVAGYTGDIYCDACNLIIEYGNPLAPTYDHIFDSGCDKICDCGYVREQITHDYHYDMTETVHYKICYVCRDVIDTEPHIFDRDCNSTCKCGYMPYPPDHKYDNNCDTFCNNCGFERVVNGHQYSSACATICSLCGEVRTAAPHNYNNACDTTCNTCGEIRTISHSFGAYVYNGDATSTNDGTKTRTCSVCSHKETVTATGTATGNTPGNAPGNPFTDIKPKDFYHSATLWAVSKGITKGTSETTFGPNEACTRGQIVTFLWRAAGCPEPTTTTMQFTDVGNKAFYRKAVLWAVENGITTGTSKTTFSPNEACTRGQIATFLWRAKGKPAPKSTNMPFGDVAKKDFYYTAVQWAVENKITTGTSKTTFAPAESCTRGQIVTFLYRAYK